MSEPIPNLPVPRGELVPVGNGAIEGEDLAALGRAVKALEHQTFAMRVANALGRQLGTIAHLIPSAVRDLVDRAAEKAIAGALDVALGSLARTAPRDTRRLHKAAAAVSGAAGGLFGMSSLPVELPLSTIIILRSIADIARQSGEDLADPATALACLEVFALGAHERDDTFVESGYFAARSVLARAVSEASKFVAQNAAVEAGSPTLVRLISQIGSRFGIVVSQKIAAQAVPILGAAGGAAVNYAFAEHFQSLAGAHFVVRRLERTYGKDAVKTEYDRILARETTAAYA